MKQKLLFLCFLIIVACGGIGIKVFIFDAESRRVGYLQIISSPEATVFIDGRAIAKTPFNQQLKPGTYSVKLIPISTDPSANKTVGVTWQGKVNVSPFQYTIVRRELRNTEVESSGELLTIQKSTTSMPSEVGEILVKTEPDGAVVGFDGTDMGVSPYLIRKVPVGLHELSVTSPRFRRRTMQVQVVPGGYTTIVSFQLGLDSEYNKKYAFGQAFEASASGSLPNIAQAPPSPTPVPQVVSVEIMDTSTGFLRVRNEGSLGGKEISQVKPGEIYPYIDEKNGWIKLKLTDGNEGWVKAEYVKKKYEAM